MKDLNEMRFDVRFFGVRAAVGAAARGFCDISPRCRPSRSEWADGGTRARTIAQRTEGTPGAALLHVRSAGFIGVRRNASRFRLGFERGTAAGFDSYGPEAVGWGPSVPSRGIGHRGARGGGACGIPPAVRERPAARRSGPRNPACVRRQEAPCMAARKDGQGTKSGTTALPPGLPLDYQLPAGGVPESRTLSRAGLAAPGNDGPERREAVSKPRSTRPAVRPQSGTDLRCRRLRRPGRPGGEDPSVESVVPRRRRA